MSQKKHKHFMEYHIIYIKFSEIIEKFVFLQYLKLLLCP
jgi:hypothetical protein